MVFGRHHHISLARLPGQPRPIPRGIWLRIEMLCEQLVLRDRDAFDFHRPLMPADDAVQSPVDEHPKLGFVPPLHASFVVRRRSGLRRRLGRVPFLCLSTMYWDGSWSEFHERWILLRRVKPEVRLSVWTMSGKQRIRLLLRPILLALFFFAFATRGTVPDLCIRI